MKIVENYFPHCVLFQFSWIECRTEAACSFAFFGMRQLPTDCGRLHWRITDNSMLNFTPGVRCNPRTCQCCCVYAAQSRRMLGKSSCFCRNCGFPTLHWSDWLHACENCITWRRNSECNIVCAISQNEYDFFCRARIFGIVMATFRWMSKPSVMHTCGSWTLLLAGRGQRTIPQYLPTRQFGTNSSAVIFSIMLSLVTAATQIQIICAHRTVQMQFWMQHNKRIKSESK